MRVPPASTPLPQVPVAGALDACVPPAGARGGRRRGRATEDITFVLRSSSVRRWPGMLQSSPTQLIESSFQTTTAGLCTRSTAPASSVFADALEMIGEQQIVVAEPHDRTRRARAPTRAVPVRHRRSQAAFGSSSDLHALVAELRALRLRCLVQPSQSTMTARRRASASARCARPAAASRACPASGSSIVKLARHGAQDSAHIVSPMGIAATRRPSPPAGDPLEQLSEVVLLRDLVTHVDERGRCASSSTRAGASRTLSCSPIRSRSGRGSRRGGRCIARITTATRS